MRILFLTNSLGRAGIEQNIVRLTRALTQRGHHVAVASRGGALVEELRAAGGEHHDLAARLRPGSLLRDARRVRRLLSGTSAPDVVHNYAATTALVLKASRTGIRTPPVVASIMGLHASPQEAALWSRARAWVTTFGADRVLVISPAIGRIVSSLPVRRRRVAPAGVVGIPLPPAGLREARRRVARDGLGAKGDQPVIVTIGRLAPDKSHELFVEAAALAGPRLPGAQWLIVGEGAERPRLEHLIRERGLERTVRLLGERSDVLDLLAAADVCVKPGIVEGFVGITVLEAQSMNVPVIAFETEDVKLAITHGESGLIVPRADVAALAEAICCLIGDENLASALARAGAEAATRFEIGRVTDELEAIYAELLAR